MQYYTRIPLHFVPEFNCTFYILIVTCQEKTPISPTLSIYDPLPHQMKIIKNIFKAV